MLTFLTAGIQNLVALAIVAAAAIWLVRRARRSSSSCGCARCPSQSSRSEPAGDLISLEAVGDLTD